MTHLHTPPTCPGTCCHASCGTCGDSPYHGQLVTVECAISAVAYNGFYCQDAPAVWSGLWIYADHSANAYWGDDITYYVGELVRVSGVIDEYYDLTEIDVSDDEEPPRAEQPYAARSIEFCHPSTWKPPRAPVPRSPASRRRETPHPPLAAARCAHAGPLNSCGTTAAANRKEPSVIWTPFSVLPVRDVNLD